MLNVMSRKSAFHHNNNKVVPSNHGDINKNFYLSRHRKNRAHRKNNYYMMPQLNSQDQKIKNASFLTTQSGTCNINQADSYEIPILIIEDDTLNQKVIHTFLKELNFRNTDIVDSGSKALTLLVNHFYGLILLDIGLPDMNGIDLCKQVRTFSRYKKIPIIAITAYENSEIQHQCLAVGINIILQKPVSILELKQTLASVLNNVN